MSRTLIWYRNDLRITDHEPLHCAVENNHEVIGVYCFDPRQFKNTLLAHPKTGSIRAQFIIESVNHLKKKLLELGCDLIIHDGKPEDFIPTVASTLNITNVAYHKVCGTEEKYIEWEVEKVLLKTGIKCKAYWGSTLINPADLPFPIKRLPDLFTDFRKKVEREFLIQNVFVAPKQLRGIKHTFIAASVSLDSLNLAAISNSPKSAIQFVGGELEAQGRLNQYIWQTQAIQTYKQTRNGLLGENYSSKLSPWLAIGCLSAKYIYHEIKKYEREQIKNDSTYWLVFELLWRDYFHFISMKYGRAIFELDGLQGKKLAWKEDATLFEAWRIGQTGYPFVDANMRELMLTGFMSNRGRQNVASFLTKNLGINWLWGAQWFESQLIDYDVSNNYGNWNYSAGVGNDGRSFRYFNIRKQALDYDAKGEYVRHWLPELKNIPGFKAHEPFKLNAQELDFYELNLGKDYPLPIVDLEDSVQQIKENQYK